MAAVITLVSLSLVIGLGLSFASEIFKVEEDERYEDVTELLPGYDCGACGYPGCSAFAEAIVDGEAERVSLCKPGKDKNYDAIIEYLKDHPNPDGSVIDIKK